MPASGRSLFSLLIGLACLRLRGPYVALLTLAIAQVMYLLIITDTACFYMEGVTCRNFTGGTRGLSKFGDFGFREMLGRREYLKGDYYLSLFLLSLALVFSFVIIRSPLGLSPSARSATTRNTASPAASTASSISSSCSP